MNNTTAVSFEDTRQNLIDLFSAKDTFKDINFVAPAISTLIDALAYTSTNLLMYTNFALGECTLDSAQLRSNIVSRAKGLGYTPTQYTATKNSIRLKVTNTNLSISESTIVPSGTEFVASTGSSTYKFVTIENSYFKQGADSKWYVDLVIVEGTFVTDYFIQDAYYTTKYILSNKKIDTRYLSVLVKPTFSAIDGVEYQYAKDIESIDPTSNIYYIQESYNGNVEIYFGDGFLGTKLSAFNSVAITSLVTSGDEAKDINKYSLASNIGAISPNDISITLLENILPGASKESDNSIKFTAPKMFQAQNRTVTSSDYIALIKSEFGEWIDSISVWGGEENIPPQYGKVYLSIKPKNLDSLSTKQQNEILSVLQKKRLPCISTEFITPSIIKLDLVLDIGWNPFKTNKIKSELYSLLESKILTYFSDEVKGFSNGFNYSSFVSELISTESSILNLSVDMKMNQYSVISSGTGSYIWNFNNSITPGSVIIGTWSKLGSSEVHSITDSSGFLYYNSKKVGTVNYVTGNISLQTFDFEAAANTIINVRCIPQKLNLYTAKNYMIGLNSYILNILESK